MSSTIPKEAMHLSFYYGMDGVVAILAYVAHNAMAHGTSRDFHSDNDQDGLWGDGLMGTLMLSIPAVHCTVQMYSLSQSPAAGLTLCNGRRTARTCHQLG